MADDAAHDVRPLRLRPGQDHGPLRRRRSAWVDDNEIANDPRVRARGAAPAAILALGVNGDDIRQIPPARPTVPRRLRG